MGRTATFDLSPGGDFRVEVVPGQVAVGAFVVIDPPRRLVHTWGWHTSEVAEVFTVADGRIDSLAIYFDSARFPG